MIHPPLWVETRASSGYFKLLLFTPNKSVRKIETTSPRLWLTQAFTLYCYPQIDVSSPRSCICSGLFYTYLVSAYIYPRTHLNLELITWPWCLYLVYQLTERSGKMTIKYELNGVYLQKTVYRSLGQTSDQVINRIKSKYPESKNFTTVDK